MSLVRSLTLCVALPLSVTAWANEPVKGKESIAGKATTSTTKAVKPAAKPAAATTALKAAPVAPVSKPVTTESALGPAKDATKSHCHSSGGSDA